LANIKSSKKAIKVIAKKTENNHELKARVKNLIKDTEKAIAANDKEKANAMFKDVQKYLDQAVSKGLIKSNTSDRQKARLSNKVKNMIGHSSEFLDSFLDLDADEQSLFPLLNDFYDTFVGDKSKEEYFRKYFISTC